MDVHIYAVFHNALYNTRESIPFILASVSLDPEAMNLQMEDIKQDIQDTTFNYLVNTHKPNTRLLYTADDIIKYIKVFLHTH